MVTPAAGGPVGAGYVVPAEVCGLLVVAARLGAAQLQRDGRWPGGFVVDAVLLGMADTAREHGTAQKGPSEGTSLAEQALSAHDLDTAQAAVLLGVQPQQVRRLARQLGGVRNGRDWRIPRARVEAERNRRAARRRTG